MCTAVIVLRRPRRAGFLALLLIACGMASSTVRADADLSREQAKAKLKALKAEIESLAAKLEAARGEHREEQNNLQEIDLSIQRSNLELKRLAAERNDHETELENLQQQRREYLASLGKRRKELAHELVAAYRIGNQSRLKLVLNLDSPARLSRLLAYYDYFSRAQLGLIAGLREALDHLANMETEINRELRQLQSVQTAQESTLSLLGRQRTERKSALAALESRISGFEGHIRELTRDRQDLAALLKKLENALADIPADLGARMGIKAQRGHLPRPAKGRIKHAFGQNRGGGLKWQGWLIQASPGSEVKSIAYGRVAFADWFRGYGLLLIIDHGDGFMSLYGNNETLFYDVGDWVEPGQVVATVGAGNGGEEGLYFELRRNGRAQDPAAWLAR